jgi:type II secretory pathway predicted ATPase ExeA
MNRLLRHFELASNPFDRNPSKEALLRHRGFEEALERLRLTVELDGIGALLAESGCGKSLLLGEFAGELQRQGWAVHYFAHSTVGPFGLVNVLARNAGLAPRRSRGETAAMLSQTLLEDERKHLLVLDEAHALADATLEDVRLLTVADFDRKSPFLLALAGQLLLEERLADPANYSLDQRITTLARLLPLSMEETRAYLLQRLAGAGHKKEHPLFEDSATEAIHEASHGVPRRINQVATAALIVAAARKRRIVCAQDVHDARIDRGRP